MEILLISLKGVEKMENIESILFVLEKIARSTGEDEDDDIFTLENEFNIKIKEEEIPSLRDVLKNECIWIWVLKPYNQKDYKSEKNNLHFIKHQYPGSINQLVKKEKLDGKDYIRYPKYVMASRVHDYIFECFLEDYGVKYEDFRESEWEVIITSKEFKLAELQVARELIAVDLLPVYSPDLILNNNKINDEWKGKKE